MEAKHQVEPVELESATLGHLIRAWHARGAPLPVAVTVSILDDLLQQPAAGHRCPEPDSVVFDRQGVAILMSEVPGTLDDMTRLVEEMLGSGDSVPPSAMSLLARLSSDDPTARPADPDQFRMWIRDALGVPAPREEVLACLSVAAHQESVLPQPSLVADQVETVRPGESVAELPPKPDQEPASEVLAEAVAEAVAETVGEVGAVHPPSTGESAVLELARETLPVPEPAEDDLDEDEASSQSGPRPTNDLVRDATIGEGHHPSVYEDYREDRLASETISASSPPAPVIRVKKSEPPPPRKESDPNRKVVRLPSASRPRVSVETVPAARRNPRPQTQDSLILSAERRGSWNVWLVVLGVIAFAVWFYVFNP